MGRQPCCDKVGLKRGPWTIEEDNKLMSFILNNGIQCWRLVPKFAGLMRCGKSCRLRWINYLRPDLKRGAWTEAEEEMIIQLHSQLGNRWSKIAAHFPGRTDNEIKNHWNTKIKKKLKSLGLDPLTHKPIIHNHHHHHQDQDHHLHGSFKSEETAEYYRPCYAEDQEETLKKLQQSSPQAETSTSCIQSRDLEMQNKDQKLMDSSFDHEETINLLAGVVNFGIQQNQQLGCCLDTTTNYMGMNDNNQFGHLEDPFQNWIYNPFPWDNLWN